MRRLLAVLVAGLPLALPADVGIPMLFPAWVVAALLWGAVEGRRA